MTGSSWCLARCAGRRALRSPWPALLPRSPHRGRTRASPAWHGAEQHKLRRDAFQGKEITRLNNIYGSILKNNNVEHVEGRAFIKDAHTIQVCKPGTDKVLRELSAKNILLALGGSPHRLDIPGAEFTITSDEALALEEQPKSVAIIGGGYIAVEFSGIFSGVGTEVHLMYRKDLPLTSAAHSRLRGCELTWSAALTRVSTLRSAWSHAPCRI